MAGVTDPLAIDGVASIARPGGRITGVSLMAAEVVAKQLEILTGTVRGVSRIAVLGNPTNAGTAPQMRYALEAAHALGVQILAVDIRSPGEIVAAFASMSVDKPGPSSYSSTSCFWNSEIESPRSPHDTACHRFTG